MMKKVLVTLIVILAGLALFIHLRSDDFSVTRTATMAVPPLAVYEYVNDLHKWESWSPWAKLDPDAEGSYAGPETGVGSSYTWSGDDQVGAGTQTIVESKPAELVRFKLDFVRPFAGTNDVNFTFKPDGGGTLVTWTMSGKNNFIGKAIGLVIDCDKMCGDFFIQGLGSLKTILEAGPKA